MYKTVIKSILLLLLLVPALVQGADVELTFWNFWDPKFILPVIKQFEKDNPGVKINNEQVSWGNGLDKIVVAMANGRAPDICELGSTWMGKFMAEGALLDVTDKFCDLKPDYMMWEPATMNGRLYGMPWLAGTRVMFYNRTLFKNAGLDPDHGPETWAELLEAARLIHNPEKGLYGFGMNAGEGHILYKKFMPFAWGNGGKIIDENDAMVFDSPLNREALDFYLRLKEFSYCEKQDLLDEAFKRGRLGLAISGSWNFARYPIDAPELDFGVTLMPKPAKDKGFSTSFFGGEILVLFKSCKDPDVAARFVRFLTTVENTLPITREALVSFPAHKGAYKDAMFTNDPRLNVFVEQMKTAVHPPVHRLWIELEKIINNTVERAMYGESPDVVFADAKREFARVAQRDSNGAAAVANASGSAAGAVVSAGQNGGSSQVLLLTLIGVGTLLNAILLLFLIYEVKKNAS
ncbi:MAG: extracellular solute-binding protein [Candidatus Riflebacteria bacterium]|nr:extracellular solute-binding protein [Candidatus Riflebacteria bacterium]